MQEVDKIRELHLELTDKCQAQCPMCARNVSGGAAREFIQNSDMALGDFKEWFPVEFLAQLNNVYSCGNYGDPAFARDCLEIFSYIRECNPNCRLAIHTNGGMRSPEWWIKLAQTFGTHSNSEVIFAVDGFKGKHELYRRNTNFDKVIENLKAYVAAGGRARVDSLVFAHNEDETDELEEFLLSLGVESVNFVSTKRFYDMERFAVQSTSGDHEYDLLPAQLPQYKQTPTAELSKFADSEYLRKVVQTSRISPRCSEEQSVYIDPRGDIFPCCWIGGEHVELPLKEVLPIHKLRNIAVERSKEMLDDIGVPRCREGALSKGNVLWRRIGNHWKGDNKCITCVRQCSSSVYENPRK